ncbi:hypothetical protein AAMO2058_001469800 [Amorphochlora amoebiformis]
MATLSLAVSLLALTADGSWGKHKVAEKSFEGALEPNNLKIGNVTATPTVTSLGEKVEVTPMLPPEGRAIKREIDEEETNITESSWLALDYSRAGVVLVQIFFAAIQIIQGYFKTRGRHVKAAESLRLQWLVLVAGISLFLWIIGSHTPTYIGWQWCLLFSTITCVCIDLVLIYVTYMAASLREKGVKLFLETSDMINWGFTCFAIASVSLHIISVIFVLISQKKYFIGIQKVGQGAVYFISGSVYIWSLLSTLNIFLEEMNTRLNSNLPVTFTEDNSELDLNRPHTRQPSRYFPSSNTAVTSEFASESRIESSEVDEKPAGDRGVEVKHQFKTQSLGVFLERKGSLIKGRTSVAKSEVDMKSTSNAKKTKSSPVYQIRLKLATFTLFFSLMVAFMTYSAWDSFTGEPNYKTDTDYFSMTFSLERELLYWANIASLGFLQLLTARPICRSRPRA